MISPETFTLDWLQNVSNRFGKKTDLKLLEKVVWALYLLEQLRQQDLGFVFKGGTALILYFENPQRLSIDIDIVMTRQPENLPDIFDTVVAQSQFINWTDDSDRKSHQKVPVGHYKFYYTPGIGATEDEPILLDVLFAPVDYARLIEKPIVHPWLKVTEPTLTVILPDINCLLGDKLTAFAPNTTGILYSKNRPLEVMKQLFDMGLLFDQATDLSLTRLTFDRLAAQEIGFRQLSISPSDVLSDVFETALILTRRDMKEPKFAFLQDGVKRLNNFIVSDFRIEHAILDASKAAYLSRLLQDGTTTIDRYQNPAQISDLQITDPMYRRLNKLRKVQPEAFFYWHQAIHSKPAEKLTSK